MERCPWGIGCDAARHLPATDRDAARSFAATEIGGGGNAASEVQRGQWWRLLTSMFLHGGFAHLASNMLGLALAGTIMIGAIFTLLRNREPFKHLAPALIFSALVVATVALRG